MKMTEALEKIRQGDAKTAGTVANFLRFKKGMNYREIFEFINKHIEISLAAWDSLLGESDEE